MLPVEIAKTKIEQDWTELIWTLSDNDMANFKAFKESDIFDFFLILKSNEKKYNNG